MTFKIVILFYFKLLVIVYFYLSKQGCVNLKKSIIYELFKNQRNKDTGRIVELFVNYKKYTHSISELFVNYKKYAPSISELFMNYKKYTPSTAELFMNYKKYTPRTAELFVYVLSLVIVDICGGLYILCMS